MTNGNKTQISGGYTQQQTNPLSRTDTKIVKMLQKDARTPLATIAKAVKLSENGVKYRVKKLRQDGVIKDFVALVSPENTGMAVKALINVDLQPTEIYESLNRIEQMNEIIGLYYTSGEYPITAIGHFSSNEHLTNFINNNLLRNCNVKGYTVDIVIMRYKDEIYHL